MGRRVLLKTVLTAAALVTAALLLRDALAIFARVPLDPNEGWNAYHALAAMSGHPLYPHAPAMMVNNYPPLSFYLIGALGKLTGDEIVAGRLVSLAAFLVMAPGLAALLRQRGASLLAGLFGGLALALTLLIGSDYVAMDDPQLLGHALQILGLVLLTRARPAIFGAALLMAAGLFVKHNLVAMPLAAALWLAGQDRKAAIRFVLTGLGAGVAGLLALQFLGRVDLLHEIFSPRLTSFANFQTGLSHFLPWALLPTAALLWLIARFPNDRDVRFVALYAVIAIVLGMVFSSGDGVDANVFFDAVIALALAGGLAFNRFEPLWVVLAYLFPLAALLVTNSNDSNFAFTAAFRAAAPRDIGFIADKPGPALCEDLALCYWAGKTASVDVFNMSEAFATHARDDHELAAEIGRCPFGSLQFDSLDAFALGPRVRSAVLAHYRVDHRDDNGVFLVRDSCGRLGSP